MICLKITNHYNRIKLKPKGETSMDGFNFHQFFKEQAIDTKNTRIRLFYEFLKKKLGATNENAVDLLKNLTVEDIKNSVVYYIDKNKVKGRGPAKDYTTQVKDIFMLLSKNYGIKNKVFLDTEHHDKLEKELDAIYEPLKKAKREKTDEDLNIASEELVLSIRDYLSRYLENVNYIKIYKELDNITVQDGLIKRCGAYWEFVSTIPVRLALDYGVKNDTLNGLMIEDYNIELNTLKISPYITLQLTQDYRYMFEKHLEVRNYHGIVVGSKLKKLFIDRDGNEIDNGRLAGTILRHLEKSFSSTSLFPFAYRKILEYMDRGMDITTISDITGVSANTCVALQELYHKDKPHVLYNDLNTVGSETPTGKVLVSKSYLRCPSCGNLTGADASNWVVVQYDDKKASYLACKLCKGETRNE